MVSRRVVIMRKREKEGYRTHLEVWEVLEVLEMGEVLEDMVRDGGIGIYDYSIEKASLWRATSDRFTPTTQFSPNRGKMRPLQRL